MKAIILSEQIKDGIKYSEEHNNALVKIIYLGVEISLKAKSDPILVQLDWQLSFMEGNQKPVGPCLMELDEEDLIGYSQLLAKILDLPIERIYLALSGKDFQK